MPLKEHKVEKLYWTIGELAKELDVAPTLLRFWEKEFKEIHPKRKNNITKHRRYSKKDVGWIEYIYYLVRVELYTIEGAKRQLSLEKKTAREKFRKNWNNIFDKKIWLNL